MNYKEKIIISILLIMLILTMNFMVLINSVKAASVIQISQVDLHSRGTCAQLLKYKGVIVKTAFVEYTYNGKNYPAYCLDKTLTGVSDSLAYSVTPNGKVEDLGLWRTIINGYPYKSITELGVANDEEAFTATKQAVYCYLFENTPEDYEAIGEAGQRTLNALHMIVANAQNSTETQIENTLTIKVKSDKWLEDDTDSNYMSKTYSISSIVNHKDYEISIEGTLPEGAKIINESGKEIKEKFTEDEFKIMLPKEKLENDGEFKINIKTETKVKPIIYGASPSAELQNYALTAYMYEDSNVTYKESYTKIEKPQEPEKPKEIEKTIEKKQKPIEEVKILPVTGM